MIVCLFRPNARALCVRASEKESKLRRVERSQPPAFPWLAFKKHSEERKSEIGIGIVHSARTLADTRFSTRCTTTTSHKRPHRRGDRRGLCLERALKSELTGNCALTKEKKFPSSSKRPLQNTKILPAN